MPLTLHVSYFARRRLREGLPVSGIQVLDIVFGDYRGYIGVYIGIMESKRETANIRRQWQILAPPRIFLCVFRNMTPVESARDPVVSLQLAYIYIYIPIGWLWGTVVLIQAMRCNLFLASVEYPGVDKTS